MPDAIWIDRREDLAPRARALESSRAIGLDTEFLRERTFFPKLCLLQLAPGEGILCIDALEPDSLDALVPALTAPGCRKIIHSARQDLEALYLRTRRVVAPVFDTQIAAGCAGFKPQIGYADLVKTLLDVSLQKGQTRTDWSKRPLSREQLMYAADDVRYLEEIADRLMERLRRLGRESWALEDCAALEDPRLYEPDASLAWQRLRGIGQLPPPQRARARCLAEWRETLARTRDLPRQWILPDPAIFALAERNPASLEQLQAMHPLLRSMDGPAAEGILEALRKAPQTDPGEEQPSLDLRPSPEQKALIERLAGVVDARAASLELSPEILAPRGELKALAMGVRSVASLAGWRRAQIGEQLLEAIG